MRLISKPDQKKSNQMWGSPSQRPAEAIHFQIKPFMIMQPSPAEEST